MRVSSYVHPAGPVRFGGVQATRAARERFLSLPEYVAFLQNETSPYVGEAPAGLPEKLGLSEESFLRHLDLLAQKLLMQEVVPPRNGRLSALFSSLLAALLERPAPEPKTLHLDELADFRDFPASVEWLGAGGNGTVYRLRLGDAQFAFKVAHSRSLIATATKNFLHLNHLGASDVARFICGNPAKNWMLTELVGDGGPGAHERDGKPMREYGFVIEDDWYGNRVRGVYVDLDLLVKLPDPPSYIH